MTRTPSDLVGGRMVGALLVAFVETLELREQQPQRQASARKQQISPLGWMRSPVARIGREGHRGNRERHRDAKRVRCNQRATYEPASLPVRCRTLPVPDELSAEGVGRLQRRDYAGVAGLVDIHPLPCSPSSTPTRLLDVSSETASGPDMSVLVRRSFGKGGARVIPRYFDRSVGRCAKTRVSDSSGGAHRAGTPATTPPDSTSRVTTAPAPTSAPAPIRHAARARPPRSRSTPLARRRWSGASQSSAVCRAPASVVARGVLSLTNMTPWPTKTSSSIVTPSQMNVWLWILQRAPIDGAALDLDERPDRESRRRSRSRRGS